MRRSNAPVPLPALTIDGEGLMRSTQFDDVYFSRDGGVAETEHVFLRGNNLPERWQHSPHFTIGELGFGSGLNFLVAWQKFLETAPTSHHLHYLSFEQYPLTREMLVSACAQGAFRPRSALPPSGSLLAAATHDNINLLYGRLIAAYPLRIAGFHRVHFDRVTLTLAFGDANELMPQLETGNVDAWFLDGFSPAKNPELWGDDILREVARLSARDATLATYTVASAVRRGLEAAGFTLDKQRGFGKKREMLVGSLNMRCEDAPATAPPRFAIALGSPLAAATRPIHSTPDIIIAGAGIAGCTLARTLAERGIAVTLLERTTIASGASGNAAAALYPQITKQWTPASAWHFSAYGFALRRYARWKSQGLDFGFASPGMARVASREDASPALRNINDGWGIDPAIARWCEADALSELTGLPLQQGGVWFPHGSWIAPAELCRSLVQHKLIALHEHSEVVSLTREANDWCVTTKNGERHVAARAAVCSAQDAAALVPNLRLGLSAGQVSIIPAPKKKLRAIFCHKGYVVPQGDRYVIGATYEHDDFSCAVTQSNHQQNIDELKRALPGWVTDDSVTDGRTSLRATTPDRLPYVGQVQDGLYVSTGFGSRGMISAPLAAEVIASSICGEIIPLEAELRTAIAPLRHATASSSVRAKPSAAKIAS